MALNGTTKLHLPKIKNGLRVIYFEKINGEMKHIPCLIDNVRPIGDNYSFELIDISTSQPLTAGGKRRSWHYIEAYNRGTIKFAASDNMRLCPECQNNFLSDNESVCISCRIKEKQSFFEARVKLNGAPFLLDSDQAEAVLADRNSIVTARAGSGKTRVLTAKLIDLFCNHGVSQNEVLAFCFNTDAAAEIRRRLNSECTVDGIPIFRDYDVVKTFHSFAVNILGSEGSGILADGRKQLIKQIITDLRNTSPRFEAEIRKYFLGNTLKIDRKNFSSDKEYYRYIRSSRLRTLGGEHVRSSAEKFIADFLFEHDIDYIYERPFYLGHIDLEHSALSASELAQYKQIPGIKNETVPDFYLPNHKIVWEHWGITGNETQTEKTKFTNEVGDYRKYCETKEWKQRFWNDWRHRFAVSKRYKNDFSSVCKLIETSPSDFDFDNRNQSEESLKRLLEAHGIKCKKLPEEVIIKKVWEKAQDYFTEQIVRFTDKFQQIYIDDENAFIDKAKNIADEREKAFLRLGYMVYREYADVLNGKSNKHPKFRSYNLDFNQCLHYAAKKIRSGDCDDTVCKLKWLLIDEYQDFSELFFGLIDAILSRNPHVLLFCVGDDWQAINRFAGSDLKFFSNFKAYFPNAQAYNIGTNYRSEKHIVAHAGNFMNRFGIEGTPQNGVLDNTGGFYEKCIDDILNDSAAEYNWLFEDGGPWADSGNTYQWKVKAYIKFCADIINRSPGSKIMILCRKNSLLGKDLEDFACILRNPLLCRIPSPDIDVKTVHRAKGEEADIVILAEVDENHFPIFHPDTNLYGIFGANERTAMEDETRLYYVALTRARRSVYILYSAESPSCFIENPIAADVPYRFSDYSIPF